MALPVSHCSTALLGGSFSRAVGGVGRSSVHMRVAVYLRIHTANNTLSEAEVVCCVVEPKQGLYAVSCVPKTLHSKNTHTCIHPAFFGILVIYPKPHQPQCMRKSLSLLVVCTTGPQLLRNRAAVGGPRGWLPGVWRVMP